MSEEGENECISCKENTVPLAKNPGGPKTTKDGHPCACNYLICENCWLKWISEHGHVCLMCKQTLYTHWALQDWSKYWIRLWALCKLFITAAPLTILGIFCLAFPCFLIVDITLDIFYCCMITFFNVGVFTIIQEFKKRGRDMSVYYDGNANICKKTFIVCAVLTYYYGFYYGPLYTICIFIEYALTIEFFTMLFVNFFIFRKRCITKYPILPKSEISAAELPPSRYNLRPRKNKT